MIMDIAPLQRRLEASEVAPEQLAAHSRLTEEQKLAEASRQFEAILLRQILENVQKPVIRSDYTEDSMSSSIYRDLVTVQLADAISKSGNLGLGKTLEHQLARSPHSNASTETSAIESAASKPLLPLSQVWPQEPKAPSL